MTTRSNGRDGRARPGVSETVWPWRDALTSDAAPSASRGRDAARGSVGVLAGALIWWLADHALLGAIVASIGGVIVVTALIWRGAHDAIQTALAAVARVIVAIVTTVTLFVFFALVFVPAGLLLRLRGIDPMLRRPDPDQATYWTRHRGRAAQERYERPF